jgi:hypothetical protein
MENVITKPRTSGIPITRIVRNSVLSVWLLGVLLLLAVLYLNIPQNKSTTSNPYPREDQINPQTHEPFQLMRTNLTDVMLMDQLKGDEDDKRN